MKYATEKSSVVIASHHADFGIDHTLVTKDCLVNLPSASSTLGRFG